MTRDKSANQVLLSPPSHGLERLVDQIALEDVVARIAPVPIRVEPAVAELIALKQPQVTSKNRRLVFDPLTKAQTRQLREMSRRIMNTIGPNDGCLR